MSTENWQNLVHMTMRIVFSSKRQCLFVAAIFGVLLFLGPIIFYPNGVVLFQQNTILLLRQFVFPWLEIIAACFYTQFYQLMLLKVLSQLQIISLIPYLNMFVYSHFCCLVFLMLLFSYLSDLYFLNASMFS